MRAIRRFTVRPVLPRALAALGDLAGNLRWSWHPRDAGRLRGRGRRPVGGHRARPGDAAGRGEPRPARRAGRATQRFLEQARRWRRPTSTPTSPATAGTSRKAGAEARRAIALLLPGVRHHRRAAAVLRRPRHPRRRPPQGRQRPRRPARRRRPALPRTATSSSRSPARAGSRRPTPSSTPTGCRSRCCARPTASGATISIAMPGGPDLLARIWVAQVGRVPLLLLDSDVEGNPDHYRDVTDRLYGGNSEHRLRQELLLGVGGVRALRALLADHRRPGARGLPHQRGPRRLPRPRADPRAHRGRRRPAPRLRHRARGLPRRHRLHHAHPGARRASTGSRATWSSSTSASRQPAARRAARPDPGPRQPRTTRAATPASSTWR